MDEETLEKYKQAGKITAEALAYGKNLIKPEVKLLDVVDAVEEFVKKKNAGLAFPAQISVNHIAAHYCPDHDDATVFKVGDLVKLDVGCHVDGFVGDSAVTVDLGNHKDIVEASQKALQNALSIVKPGVTLGEIGRTIQETITAYNLTPIKNLSGHGLDQWEIHSNPSIPNFDTKDKTVLAEGMVIAIEPFATNGQGWIYESSNPTIFAQVANKPVRSPFSREVLREIQEYNGLPFARRWLVRKFGLGKTSFALKELMNLGIIKDHPPLPEKANGLVSQAEHSVIVLDKPLITTQL
ncbi:type II methionyl aminopeptidase [Candidatus Woesearchaeota archaeon]|nr:MAG: type II methionyl aminopeptidase [Candidatus Woesearchaeota archaeon]